MQEGCGVGLWLGENTVRAGRAAAPADEGAEVPVMLSDATPTTVDVQVAHAAIMGLLSGLSGLAGLTYRLDVSFKLMADSDPTDALLGKTNLLIKISHGSVPATSWRAPSSLRRPRSGFPKVC